jgi:hypothetical protein
MTRGVAFPDVRFNLDDDAGYQTGARLVNQHFAD